MIQLYGFSPVWGLPDCSPFVTKVDVYLRLAKLPYENVPFSFEVFAAAPKGKYPCIADGDEKIADSNFIIEYLKHKYGDVLDANLNPTEHAVGHAVKRMLDENLYWVLVAERWRDTTAAVEQYPICVGLPPDILKAVVDTMLGELRGHGLGRHTPEDVESIGKADLGALSNILGDNPYLLGDTPSSYDATAYSFVAHFIQPEYDSRMKRFISTLPNLMGYWDRLGAMLYRH